MNKAEELQQSSHHITNSISWLLLRLCSGIFLVETAYVLFLVLALTPFASEYHSSATITLWVLHTVKFLSLLALTLSIVVPWGSTHYYMTDRQLIKYVGLSRRDETLFDLSLLKAIELHQGWFGRMFNYGDVSATFSSSGYTQKIYLRGIFNPKKYERVLRAHLSAS